MEKHSGDTDKPKEVKLTSSIEQVLWTNKSGTPGGKVGLQITTQLVGNNSEVSVQISDKSGSTFDTIKKKMFGSKCWVEVTVPDKAKEELFAEVKLSKLSLTKKSNGLVVYPPIEIKNLKWDRDEVHRGDIVKITADVMNIYDGAEAEIQIWEYDSDLAHDFVASIPVTIKNKKIETQWEFQYVEDTDDIPTQEETESGYQWPEYFFRVIVGGKSEDSKIMKFKDWVEVEWLYPNGQPAANKKFKLFLADGNERSETFDENGKFRLEDIPPGPVRVALEDDDSDSNDSDSEEETKQTVKIALKDSADNSYSNKKYEIHYGLDTVTGNTNGEGLIEAELPSNVQEAKLLVWLNDNEEVASYSTTIQFETLEPETDPKGIQKRLQNLGYYNDAIDGEVGPMTNEAIKRFQMDNNLPVTGILNPEVSEKINKKFKNS